MMRERAVSLNSGGELLSGTLTLPGTTPARPYPTVLMLHGSGPLDRDANMPGQRLDIFNTLAEALAGAGMAALRWDKRGCGASGGDYLSHGLDDLVADARAWADWCASQPDLDPLVLLGHSEGTLIAPMLARGHSDLAAMVLICPFADDAAQMLRRQAAHMARSIAAMPGWGGRLARLAARLTGGPQRGQDRLIARLRATSQPVLRAGLTRIPARSLRDLLRADCAAIHAAHQVPTLALSAEHDIQCDPDDAARIAALNPCVTAALLPGLSHLLRPASPGAGFADYAAQIARPMDPQVGADVAGWLARTLPQG